MLSAIAASVGEGEVDENESDSLLLLVDQYFPNYDFGVPGARTSRNEQPEKDSEVNVAERALIWEKLASILASASETKRKRGVEKINYAEVIDTLKMEAKLHGFAVKELQEIWKVASHPKVKMNCGQRSSMILVMAPNEPVGEEIITPILTWLTEAHANGFKPTVLVAVYQLLNLFVEYHLTKEESISNETVLTQLLASPTQSFVIPWKMNLFRSVMTAAIVTDHHVAELKQLMESDNIKKTHRNDIKRSIELIDALKPVSYDNGKTRVESTTPRMLTYPEGIRSTFNARRQQQLTLKLDVHPLGDKIFPEFLPPYRIDQRTIRKTSLEIVLTHLETEEGIAELAMRPELMEKFVEWMNLVLYHRFHHFSEFFGEGDIERYVFVLETCVKLVTLREKSLGPAFNTWAFKFVVCWDFCLFRKAIYTFLRYLDPSDVITSEANRAVTIGFSQRFRNSPWARKDIWELFTKLFKSWMLVMRSPLERTEEVTKGVKWVLEMMERFVVSMTLDFNPNPSDPTLIHHICEFYLELQNENVEGIMEEDSFHAVPTALPALVVLTRNRNTLQLLKEIVKRMEENGASGEDPFIRDTKSTLQMINARGGDPGNLLEIFARRIDLPEVESLLDTKNFGGTAVKFEVVQPDTEPMSEADGPGLHSNYNSPMAVLKTET